MSNESDVSFNNEAPKQQTNRPAVAKPIAKKEPKPKQAKSILTASDKREITKAVKTQETGVMNPVEYEQIKVVARDLIKSEAVPASFENENQVFMALLNGRSMGMEFVEALNSFYIVNGKLTIYGAARLRQLRKIKYKVEYKESNWLTDEAECTAIVTNIDDPSESYEETVTFAEAQASKYTESKYGLKAGWYKGINRKKKLRYLAVDVIIDSYIPEAKGGVVGSTEIVQDAPVYAERVDQPSHADNINEALKKKKAQEAEVVESDDFESSAVEDTENNDDDN